MKRIRYLSGKVKQQIVEDYKLKKPNGDYMLSIKTIAAKHEVCTSTVSKLACAHHCQGRPHGGIKLTIPDARTMKILRDMTIPGMTQEECGNRNPRIVIVGGRQVVKPLSKQRIKQIVDSWKKRGMPNVHSRGFKPGDVVEWCGYRYVVLRYDDKDKGAVRSTITGETIDPFLWVRKGQRLKLVEEAGA